MSEDRPQDAPSPWSTPPPGGDPSGERTAPVPVPYGGGSASPPPLPYGQPAAYGQQYGAPAHPTGYAPSPESAQVRSSATLWLILNIVSVLFCANLPGIAGAIYAGLALGRVDVDPVDARRKTRIAKILFFSGLILGVALAVVAAVLVFALGTTRGSIIPSVPATGV